MNIIFFGSSNYCLPILKALINNFILVSVVTKKNQSVEKYAQSHNIKSYTPANKEELINFKNDISSLKPDLAIVADYGIIIPKEIFFIPRYRTLNIHFSLLPKLRGPAPVQYTILLGEEKAGISVIIMDEDLDTGDIVWQKEIPLTSGKLSNYPINQLSNSQIIQLTNNPVNETAESLYKNLFNIISIDLPNIINKYAEGELKPQKQNHSQATYTRHFTREDGYIPFQILAAAINWKNKTLTEKELKNWPLLKKIPQLAIIHYPLSIDRAIRALSPWPGVWTTIKITDNKQQITKRLKIIKVHLEPTTYNLQPTTKLVLDLVQLESKKSVSWKQFTEGYPGFTFS